MKPHPMTAEIGRFLGLLCVSVILLANRAGGDVLQEISKLTREDGSVGDGFGVSVSVSGDVAMIGALLADGREVDAGAAYVYRLDGSTWAEEQKLTASDGVQLDAFGRSVSVNGEVAVVGSFFADGNETDTGAAYVFRFDGSSWVEEQKLTASDGVTGDLFGLGVSLDGDTVLIGAFGDGDNGSQSGSAYVFRFDGSTWVEEQKLTASDGAAGDNFGLSLSLSGNVALISALEDDDNGNGSGSAYVFRFDGSAWVEEQKLIASDGSNSDRFGLSVSVDGDAALIGAIDDDDNGRNSGSAYLYRFDGSTWVEEQKLTASDGAEGDGLGVSVSLSGDAALVGASTDGDNGQVSGSAYVYRFDGSTWVEDQKLLASDGAEGDFFGGAVSLDGYVAVLGAFEDDAQGSAYVFFGADCLEGTVNAGNDSVFNVLFVDGSSGGPDRTVEVTEGDFIPVTILKPLTGGSGRFVLHANEGRPTVSSAAVLPFDIGTTCFPFFCTAGASPVIVANNVGKTNLVGQSEFLGTPAENPDPASTTLVYPDLPLGTILTLQGVVFDPGAASSRGARRTA